EFFRPDAASRLFPAYEVLPGESNVSHELAAQRLELLAALAEGVRGQGIGVSKEDSSIPYPLSPIPSFIVAPIQALMQPSPNKQLPADHPRITKTGNPLARDALVQWLVDHGYPRLDAVEDAGDFAVRGEIVDVWPPGDEEPVRIDFFGDQIESIK